VVTLYIRHKLYRKPKHILRSTNFFLFNRAAYKIMWNNIIEAVRTQVTTGQIRKSTNTISEYAVITAFQLQQWLHESASVLHYNTLFVYLFLRASAASQDVLQPAGLLYRPLSTFQLWPPDAPAPTDAFRTLAAEVRTYGRGIRTGNFA
jgi:hypothetical protein